jgi:hypothetical protein
MSIKPIDRVENLTRPGEPVAAGDTYREFYTDGTFRTFVMSYASTGSIFVPPIRVIATKAFYRRMTQAERTTLRGTADETSMIYGKIYSDRQQLIWTIQNC